jgi:transposase
MGIDAQGNIRLRVPETLGYRDYIHTGINQLAGVGVAQVVERKIGHLHLVRKIAPRLDTGGAMKLTRTQRRQLEKLSCHVERVTDTDRVFFEQRPDRKHRVRIASEVEIAQLEIVNGEVMTLPPGMRHFAIVRNVAPGTRLRAFVTNAKHAVIVETIARIRREHFIKGKTIKEIARDLKVSRNTVRKVLRSGETSFEYERVVQPRPKLGRWAAELDGLLAGNAAKAAREQLTLIRIFEELRGRGYDGGYDAVRRYARRWSKERGQSTAAAYVPLSFAPGEAYQFDWSHEVVLLNGVTVMVKAAHVRLCHSRMLFVRCYPRETQEMVFDAHDRAFALFKGTCGRGIYDNMKTAVETIFVGKGRLYNRRFMQMCSHYLVDPVACTPASGWEKGQVENQVGLVRERFFTPRLRFKTLDELNAWLLDKCIAYAKAHRHPELTEQTVWEVFEAERPKLVPYAGRFDGFHAVPASVSKTCLVRFDNNKYSVTASAVGRPVEVHAYADRIVIRQDGRIVAEHPRSFGRGETTYDPWHYVPVLARKPGALRNGAPFKDWVLPAAIERVRRKLAGADDGNRQMVDILNAVLTDGLPAVEAACAEAIAHGVHSADVVLNILARQRDPAPPANILTPAALTLRHAPIADCARYDNLRRTI